MKSLDQHRPLVLLVDDEPEVLEEVAEVLMRANFSCRCCTDVDAGVAAAEADPPDLIISDINLRGQSGLQMCETIKSKPGLGDVPVMFLSGAQIPDIIRRSHDAGGTYYLRKPFDPEVLVELVDKALWMPQVTADRAQAMAGAR